jgi:hypothetical protein
MQKRVAVSASASPMAFSDILAVLAEAETETTWARKRDALEALAELPFVEPLPPAAQRQLLNPLLAAFGSERSIVVGRAQAAVSSIALRMGPRCPVLFSEPLVSRLIELSGRKGAAMMARAATRALCDAVRAAPAPNALVMSASKCMGGRGGGGSGGGGGGGGAPVPGGAAVEANSGCREAAARALNVALCTWPREPIFRAIGAGSVAAERAAGASTAGSAPSASASASAVASLVTDADPFPTLLLAGICDRDETVRRLSRVNMRLLAARFPRARSWTVFPGDVNVGSYLAKLDDPETCSADAAAVARLNASTQDVPAFSLDFAPSAGVEMVAAAAAAAAAAAVEEAKGGGRPEADQGGEEEGDEENGGAPVRPRADENSGAPAAVPSVSLGEAALSLAAASKAALGRTMAAANAVLPLLARLDQRVAAAQAKATLESQDPLAAATAVLQRQQQQQGRGGGASLDGIATPADLEQLADGADELVKVLEALLPGLKAQALAARARARAGGGVGGGGGGL